MALAGQNLLTPAVVCRRRFLEPLHVVTVWAVEGGNEKINVTTTGHATLTHLPLLSEKKHNEKLISCTAFIFFFLVFLGGRPTELPPISINGFSGLFLLPFSPADGEDQRMGHTNQLESRLVLSFFS